MSYIKLHHRMLKWGWIDSPETLALWVHILLRANYKPTEWHGEMYEEGTFPTSIEKLSIESGLSVRTVRTCLERLKKSNEIRVESTNKGTKICVVKWADYQCSYEDTDKPVDTPRDKQMTIIRQADDKQTTTIKEYKNTRNTRNIYYRPTIEEVESYCRERNKGVDPQRWFNYYQANGWKVGKNPMKDWRACVRTWERNTTVSTVEEEIPTYDDSHNKCVSSSEEKELLRLMGRV